MSSTIKYSTPNISLNTLVHKTTFQNNLVHVGSQWWSFLVWNMSIYLKNCDLWIEEREADRRTGKLNTIKLGFISSSSGCCINLETVTIKAIYYTVNSTKCVQSVCHASKYQKLIKKVEICTKSEKLIHDTDTINKK